MGARSQRAVDTGGLPSHVKSAASGLVAAHLGSACGGGGDSNPSSMQGSYDLQAAMATLLASGLSDRVTLSGTVIVNGTSHPFTGTGTCTYSRHRRHLQRSGCATAN